MATTTLNSKPGAPDMRLFWGCFIALVATSFGFIARALTANEWAIEFGLTETQKGEILGAGLWPFAISIILFSLVIDRIGYKMAMYFGLACHIVSTIIILMATGYDMMYLGTFILALGSGTVEAYINPVVATMFQKDKTKWLNILHAGWPGGLVIGGILAIALGADVYWKVKIGLILIPTAVYAVMLWNKAFPINERVAAGVSYKDMLREVGTVGALIISTMVVMEIGRLFAFPLMLNIFLIIALTAAYAYYTRSVGRPLFILLLLIMMPLATTELGIDSWITSLMETTMKEFGIAAGWVLVYTSLIMMVLRFFAGPIVHRLSPLGLLAVSALIAALGLMALSNAVVPMAILGAATLYGVGKTFFWPTTLGVVAEQFPRGGALTLNTVAGVGMLAVGIVGNPFLGYFQDTSMVETLKQDHQAIYSDYKADKPKLSVFGNYEFVNEGEVTLTADKVALYQQRDTLQKQNKEVNSDPVYQNLVKNAFAHLKPGDDASADQKAAYEAVADSYEARLAYIQDKGLIVDQATYTQVKNQNNVLNASKSKAQKSTLQTVSILPIFMLLFYIGLILYFRSKGGYKPAEIEDSTPQ